MKHLFIFLLFICGSTYSQVEKIKIEKEDSIFTIVEEHAEFPGGYAAMNKFIMRNLIWPIEYCEHGCYGSIFVKFTVSTTGHIKDIYVLKGINGCPAFDNEVIRVIKLMPQWKPACLDGKIVNCYFTIPIRIRIQ